MYGSSSDNVTVCKTSAFCSHPLSYQSICLIDRVSAQELEIVNTFISLAYVPFWNGNGEEAIRLTQSGYYHQLPITESNFLMNIDVDKLSLLN
jgi:hypothetical protein